MLKKNSKNQDTQGTSSHMSPELLREANVEYNESCEVYSFAIVMYELFFEIEPYQAVTSALFKTPNDYVYKYSGESMQQRVMETCFNERRPEIPDIEYSPFEKKYLDLMEVAWAQDPLQRPLFNGIQFVLASLLEKK